MSFHSFFPLYLTLLLMLHCDSHISGLNAGEDNEKIEEHMKLEKYMPNPYT